MSFSKWFARNFFDGLPSSVLTTQYSCHPSPLGNVDDLATGSATQYGKSARCRDKTTNNVETFLDKFSFFIEYGEFFAVHDGLALHNPFPFFLQGSLNGLVPILARCFLAHQNSFPAKAPIGF